MLLRWPLGGGHVRFEGSRFVIHPSGQPVVTFRAEDRGEIIDLIAWAPTMSKVGSWHGAAFCLGDADQFFNPATCFGGSTLRVHRTPLEWLKAQRDGIVIVQPRLAYAYLRNVPRLSFADRLHAQRVKRWLQPPKPKTEILIEVPRGR